MERNRKEEEGRGRKRKEEGRKVWKGTTPGRVADV
jgi:hypothetical protein